MLRLVEIELLLELVYTSACINKLLLAGEKRMAFRANINLNVVLYGLGNIFCATSTLNGSDLVIGMEILLHFINPLFRFMVRGKAPTIRTLKYITQLGKMQYLFSNFYKFIFSSLLCAFLLEI